MTDVVVTVGTKKGLFLLTSDAKRDAWKLHGPFLNGTEVHHAMVDPRDGAVYATANDAWFGNRVSVSRDRGATWTDRATAPRFPEESGKKVERLWRLEPGRPSEPGVLYCGVDPATLFWSEDGGDSWYESEALGNHATRGEWNPGAGGLILHSIVLDPQNASRMWVAISAAGVFRSDDGGASWQAANTGMKNTMAKYDASAPEYVEVGQCVHHVVRAAGAGERLYAQAHYGTYRSDDGATTWTDITAGLPSDFGFAIAAHPRDADSAFVVPLQGAEFRVPPEGKLRVWRTSDAGATWRPLTKGLPQENAYMGMYREGFAIDALDPAGLYLGTNTGQLYASSDEGESWRLVTANLPPISSVGAAVVA